MRVAFISTSDGVFTAWFSDLGLARLLFPNDPATADWGRKQSTGVSSAHYSDWETTTTLAVQAVLAGVRPTDLPPFDLSSGTDFQRRVWNAISTIETGHTLSYGQIASQIGSPRGVRAVGGACGANPVPLLIPCHRVLAQGNRLGGFSGGLSWKTTLLLREKVVWLPSLEKKSKGTARSSSLVL